jgi:hypothetical protein
MSTIKKEERKRLHLYDVGRCGELFSRARLLHNWTDVTTVEAVPAVSSRSPSKTEQSLAAIVKQVDQLYSQISVIAVFLSV